MPGSARWVHTYVEGSSCTGCGEQFTKFAIRELRFRLLPRKEGRGYGALLPIATTVCPRCGNEDEWPAPGVEEASMKHAIHWMVDRSKPKINPFTKEPIDFPETMTDQLNMNPDPDEKPGPRREEEGDDDEDEPDGAAGDARASGDTGGDEGESAGSTTATEPPNDEAPEAPDDDGLQPPPTGPVDPRKHRHLNAGRRLTVPSIRSCCPPNPISDEAVAAGKRRLRVLSFKRTAPSFPRLMKLFGVDLD